MKYSDYLSKNSFTSILTPLTNRHLIRLSGGVALASLLSGCLLSSPYWGQKIDGHTNKVPIQSFVTSNGTPVVFECSKAYHGGLYPAFGPEQWYHVATVNPTIPPSVDPKSVKIYSASYHNSLPAVCWRQDPANGTWYTAVRSKQGSSKHYVFNKTGLACLGKEIGLATTWLGWLGKGCHLTYSGSSTAIPYVRIYSTT